MAQIHAVSQKKFCCSDCQQNDLFITAPSWNPPDNPLGRSPWGLRDIWSTPWTKGLGSAVKGEAVTKPTQVLPIVNSASLLILFSFSCLKNGDNSGSYFHYLFWWRLNELFHAQLLENYLPQIEEFAICLEQFTMICVMLFLLAFPCYFWLPLNNVCLIEMYNLSISRHNKLPEFLPSSRVGSVKLSEQRDILKYMCVVLTEKWRHTKAFP